MPSERTGCDILLRVRRATVLALVFALTGCGGTQEAPDGTEPAAPMGHIHGLGVDPADDTLFVATHTGLFHLTEKGATRVADRFQDTMAFTVVGPGHFLASGHPDLQEDLPPHLGLIESTDAGETWQPLALQGEADFHALEPAGALLYGYDATEGKLLATEDRKTFREVAEIPVLSLAATPHGLVATTNRGELLALDEDGSARRLEGPVALVVDATSDGTLVALGPGGDVHLSSDAETWRPAGTIGDVPTALTVGDDAWYAATSDAVMRSTDRGATWSQIHPRGHR